MSKKDADKKLSCPICERHSCSFYRNVYDDRYGYPGIFALLKCKNCKHIFLNASFKEDALVDMYTNYYPHADYDIKNLAPCKEIKGLSSWLRGYHFSANTVLTLIK